MKSFGATKIDFLISLYKYQPPPFREGAETFIFYYSTFGSFALAASSSSSVGI